jgi:hypothetical protein
MGLRLLVRRSGRADSSSSNTVGQLRDIEVNQQASRTAGHPKVGQRLGLVNRQKTFDRLHLDYNQVLNN